MPHMEPVSWLLWLFIFLILSYSFFCVIWYVHIPYTKIKLPKSSSSPFMKW
uniref:ATP synthase subunit 8 n=1 Tax=Mimachlamys senatoria TaxID=388643 RepID=T1S9M6_9BIVA|nr:ATP synthase subunit 8 [Mimachlamys senatoria]